MDLGRMTIGSMLPHCDGYGRMCLSLHIIKKPRQTFVVFVNAVDNNNISELLT